MSKAVSPPTIVIDDDKQQQINEIDVKLQQARNKSLIEQAQITNDPMQIVLATVKTVIKGDLLIKNRQVNKTILKYFQQKIDLKISHQYFCDRIEVNYQQEQINDKQFILYGVDFITTNWIKNRFQTLQIHIKQIIWINDSNCKIVCGSSQQASKILQTQSNFVKLQQDQQLKGWFQLKPYHIFSFQRSLFIRYATINQNTFKKQPLIKYTQYQQAKKQLPLYLLNYYNAIQKYKNIIQEILQKRQDNKLYRNHYKRNQSYSRSRQKQKEIYHQKKYRNYQQSKRYRNRQNNNSLGIKDQTNCHQSNNHITHFDYQSINQINHQDINSKHSVDLSYHQRPTTKLNQSNHSYKISKNINNSLLFDQISDIESNLSFPVGKVKQDRLDYIQDSFSEFNHKPSIPQKQNNINQSFRYISKPKDTNKPINESFIYRKQIPRQQNQSSDELDFNEIFKVDKEQKNNSFVYEDKKSNSKKSNTNILDDDQSY